MLHISQCVSSRQTVWHLPHVSISFLSKVMDRKRTLLWHIVTSSGQNTFLPITIDRKEIETWRRSQFVCLDETHWLICNMTYLGHFRDLTWGQISKLSFRGHVMIKIGHVAYVSMRLDETDSVIPFPRLKFIKFIISLNSLKLLCKKLVISPMTSSCDLRWPFEGSLTPNDKVQARITAQNHTENRLSSTASRYLNPVRRYQQKAFAAPPIYDVM